MAAIPKPEKAEMPSLQELAPRIVVLSGPLRSGTTLLRVLLGEHPDLHGPGESDYLFEHLSADKLASGGSQADRAGMRAAIGRNRIPIAQGMEPPTPAPMAEMCAEMIERLMPRNGRLLLTLHRHADIAAMALPGAAFIRLRRDPRDVAVSAMKMGWTGTPFHGVDVWRQAEKDWLAAEPLITGPRSEVAFEAMTANPRAELTRVLQDIGLSSMKLS